MRSSGRLAPTEGRWHPDVEPHGITLDFYRERTLAASGLALGRVVAVPERGDALVPALVRGRLVEAEREDAGLAPDAEGTDGAASGKATPPVKRRVEVGQAERRAEALAFPERNREGAGSSAPTPTSTCPSRASAAKGRLPT